MKYKQVHIRKRQHDRIAELADRLRFSITDTVGGIFEIILNDLDRNAEYIEKELRQHITFRVKVADAEERNDARA